MPAVRQADISIPEVVDVEVVQPAGRAVPAERRRVDVVDPGLREQLADAAMWRSSHLLLDAVRAKPRDRAAHVQPCLVQRVAERLAGVAADNQRPSAP